MRPGTGLSTFPQLDERVDFGTSFGVTQEFLAEMIGANRPPVTEVVKSLRYRRLIEYSRGLARVSDQAGLEQVACECYGIIRIERDRLLATSPMHLVASDDG